MTDHTENKPHRFSSVGKTRFSSNLDPVEETPEVFAREGDLARRIVDAGAGVGDEGKRREEFADYLQQIVNKAVKKGDNLDVLERWKADYEQLFKVTNQSRMTLNRMRNFDQLAGTRRVVMNSKGLITKKKPFCKAILRHNFEPESPFHSIIYSWKEEIRTDLLLLHHLAVSKCEEEARIAHSLAVSDADHARVETAKRQELLLLGCWQRNLERELLVYIDSSRDVRQAGLQCKYELCRLNRLIKDGQSPLFRNEALNHCFKVDAILARVRQWEISRHETSISHHRRIGRRVASVERVRHSGVEADEGGFNF